MKPDITIIAVGYKSEDTIIPFLDSIKNSGDGLTKEIIIVDNYPADKCVILAEKHSLKPKVFRNTENVGFSKAINWGLRESTSDYFLIMNIDTRFVGKALKYMLEFAKTKKLLGGVAPQLLDYSGKIQPSVIKFPTILNAFKAYFLNYKNYFNKYYPGNKTVKVDIAVMASFLIPRSTYEKVGGLDERYFLYYEDVEYCRRLFRAGLPVYYFPKAKVKHIHGASGNFKSHKSSPLAKSAQIYHGRLGSAVLNFVLWSGQKYRKIVDRLFSK